MEPSTSSARSALRSRSTRLFVLLALVAVAAVGAIPMRAAAQEPIATFQSADCFVPAPEGYAVECGYVLAPESHNNFDGTLVGLATVIVRSPNPNAADDPVVFLSGGPGQAATPFAPAAGLLFERVLANRDVIFFDQRGTGFSVPSLFCPPLQIDTLLGRLPVGAFQEQQRPEILQLFVELLTACGQAYGEAGVDLTKYNTPENAADIEDLRRALGYGQLNLIGGSYGTRLALEAMRFRPATIRSAVLDSLAPPPYNFQVQAPASFNRTLEGLFAACSADAACGSQFPDTLGKWDALIARLNATPAQLPIYNLETGDIIDYLPVNGWDLTLVVFQLAYITEVHPLLPAIVDLSYQGDYTILSLLFSALFQPGGDDGPVQPALALTMLTAFQCYDDLPFVTADDFIRVRSQNLRGQPLSIVITFNEAFKDVCSNLGLGTDTPAYENQQVTSDVPAFLIAGELDPITPPQQAFDTAATLSRSSVVVYPRGGHTPGFSSPCLLNAMAAFIENPAVAPDTSCVAAEAPLPFLTIETAQAKAQQLTTERSWVERLR